MGNDDRNLTKTALCCVAVLAALVATFSVLTVLQGLIPPHLTREHMERSLRILDEETPYTTFGHAVGWDSFDGFAGQGNTVDNFTAMWMVQTADSEHYLHEGQYFDAEPYDASKREPIEGDVVARAFLSGYQRGNYWSGYRVVLKPLLMIMGIRGIRMVTMLAVLVSLVWSLVRTRAHLGGVEAFLLLGSLFLINPLNTIVDLDQAPDLIQALLSIVLVLWVQRRDVPDCYQVALFTAFGAVEAFVNCLIMPLVTLGLPLLACVLYRRKRKDPWRSQLAFSLCSCLAWGFGYAGSFFSIWMISAPFRGISPLEGVSTGIGLFVWRAGADEASLLSSMYHAVQENVNLNVPVLWLLLLGAGLLLHRACRRANSLYPVREHAALLLVGSLPLIWILVLNNHSRIHSWMVHDILAISLWSLSCVIVYELRESNHGALRERL